MSIGGTGNALDNWISGNGGGNLLNGASGNDLLWGDDGDDALQGGTGNDLLQGGAGNDALSDKAGNNLLDGGAGNDSLTGGSGHEVLAGGSGSDTLTAGGGADVILFDRGDGSDVIKASSGTDDTLSLGGGIAYADLGLSRNGPDLVLDAGAGETITFKDWYAAGVNNHSVLDLQVIADAMAGYAPGGLDPLTSRRVAHFDFRAIAGAFDAALAANPGLTRWSIASSLAGAWTSGSDASATGGDFAYAYGHGRSFAGIGMAPALADLAQAGFGATAQPLTPSASLHAGTARLH
jgi:hypothetical protein